MGLAASVVTYTVDQENADALRDAVEQHIVPAARGVDGYRGFMLLDQGDGKRLALILFDSVDGVQAAQSKLSPLGAAHTYALMSGPAIGSICQALIADGLFA